VSERPQVIDDRALFERGPIVIFKWRNEPGWPVEYVSANVVEIFGYPAADFLGGTVAYGSIVLAEDLPRVGQEVADATSGGLRSFAHEPYRVRRRDGEVRWLYDYTHVVRDAAGATTHYLGYVFDVTSRVTAEAEKHELERRLLHAQKLESLGVLAGGVAHDFNNLLTGILGQASLARKELALGGADARTKLAHGLEQIEQLALRAAELTQKLLAYSGKGTLMFEPVDLGVVLADMASILDVVITKKATVVRELAKALPAVMADRGQLQQVMMNLLTNASDSLGDEQGTITLCTSVVTLSAEQAVLRELEEAGTYVCLEVADTGCGMTDEARQRLFDPFFTTKFAGRGLGMSAVLGIVRGHRGAISVRSTVGEGSRFTVLLPATDSAVVPTSAEPTSPEWRGHGTVLVADDQRSIRTTLCLLLQSLGFACVEAENGKKALDAFTQHRSTIVLALLDMTMPEMSGAETIKALRAIAPALPVILSTGFSQEEISAKLGGQSGPPPVFLQKPYRLQELESALRAALASRQV
jgi:two-component system, cell cycle sensor histidine kinase and response regulator CckA